MHDKASLKDSVYFFLIGEQLLYSVTVVSAMHQCKPVYVYPLPVEPCSSHHPNSLAHDI